MNVSTILHKLKNIGIEYTYRGPVMEEVFAVDIAGRKTAFQEGIIYVNSSEDYQYSYSYENLCFVTVESFRVNATQEFIRGVLIDEAKRTGAALMLQQKLTEGETAANVTAYLSGVLKNPVMMLTYNATTLAHSGFNGLQNFSRIQSKHVEYFLQICQKHICTLMEANDSCNPFSKRILLSGFQRKKKDIILIVVEQDSSFDALNEMRWMELIGSVFRSTIWMEVQHDAETERQNILFHLLQSKPSRTEPVRKQLQAVNWIFYEKYYVLAIYRKMQNTSCSLVPNLTRIIGEPVYEYGDYYISILHSDWKTETYSLFGRNFPELTKYLGETNMYAGLSYGVFDVMDLSVAMKQAVKCIDLLRKYDWTQRFNGYGDMVITHLIDSSLMHGECTLNSICHPITLKIREYDTQNNTDLLDVLAAYIFSGLSVKIASEYLHMHSNTVYQRVHKLEEDFGIDFTNRRLITMLHISIVAMAYNSDFPPDKYL